MCTQVLSEFSFSINLNWTFTSMQEKGKGKPANFLNVEGAVPGQFVQASLHRHFAGVRPTLTHPAPWARGTVLPV